ncbi:MAG: hypothetical protein M1818_003404 [Claussenomyces sp. TS43310]|nr:MAG: hypothetical protein M1818_003404 [Claussenomyces sp. TS43310]
MAARLQCFGAARVLRHQGATSRAAFSTTVGTHANQTSASDDLLSIGEDPSPMARIQVPHRKRQPSFEPSRGGRPPLSSREHSQDGNPNATRGVLNLMDRVAQRTTRQQQNSRGTALSTAQELEKHKLASDLSKQIGRRWKAGDVYAPHDLTPIETQKWKKRGKPEYDVFDTLDLNPLEQYKNFSIMSEYMTPLGRIKHSSETGLRPVNQRRITKAIRRSIGLGLMPSVYKHPEILMKEVMRRNEQLSRATRQY